MLGQQQDAWAVYAAFFLLFTLFLTFRCRHNLYLLPFVIFGLMVSIFDICLIVANNFDSGLYTTDRYWINKSLVLNLLPTISLLIFLGIIESQLIFIRHISSAIESRTSLYLRDPPEKLKQQQQQKKRPRTYWLCMLSLLLYTILAFVNLLLFLTRTYEVVGVAICVSLMFVVVCFNTAGILSFTRETTTNHIRFIRRNRGDLFFLRVTPLLFSLCMGGMMMLSWVYVSTVAISAAGWIVLESLFVYLPLLCILMMCIQVNKFKKMGRQYRMEEDQKSYNHRTFSYNTTRDIESVTRKLSEEESSKVTYPPLPVYQPPTSHHF